MIDENKLIEEFEKTTFKDKNKKKKYGDLLNYLIDSIPKIEKCGDCSRRKFYQQGYADGLNSNRWIPCSENKPQRQDSENSFPTMYLVQGRHNRIHMGFRNEDGDWINEHGNKIINVMAWMPLPDPYKSDYIE